MCQLCANLKQIRKCDLQNVLLLKIKSKSVLLFINSESVVGKIKSHTSVAMLVALIS